LWLPDKATPFPPLPTVIERVGVEWEMDSDQNKLQFVGRFLNLIVALVYDHTMPYEYDVNNLRLSELSDESKEKFKAKDIVPGLFSIFFCFHFEK
jgi:hypothetical protein